MTNNLAYGNIETMSEKSSQLGGNVTNDDWWTSTGVDVDSELGRIRHGKKYDKLGQIVDLDKEKYNGGIDLGSDRNMNGRVAIQTKSGNTYYIEGGMVVNVRESLDRGGLSAGVLADHDDIEIGKPWHARSAKGREISTSDVESVSIDCVKLEQVSASDDRLTQNFDPIFQKIDNAFQVAGVDLGHTLPKVFGQQTRT